MIFPLSHLLFFISLVLGSFLTISSSSWLGAWIGLELNLLSFIPLISSSSNPYYSETALKYFLIQASASTIIIISSSIQLFNNSVYPFIILLSLLIKLGAAPFHFWFPHIMEGLSWGQSAILLSIQKLAPFMIISFINLFNHLTFFIIVSRALSAIAGSLGGFNSLKLRKLIAYSSINHISWILLTLILRESLFFLYYFFYIIISFSIIFSFSYLRTFHISNLFNFNSKNSFHYFIIPLSFISLGGLPPLRGFIPKWLVAQLLIQNEIYSIILILFGCTLVTLFFYIRISIPFLIRFLPSSIIVLKNTKFNFKTFLTLTLFIFNILRFIFPIPFILL